MKAEYVRQESEYAHGLLLLFPFILPLLALSNGKGQDGFDGRGGAVWSSGQCRVSLLPRLQFEQYQ